MAMPQILSLKRLRKASGHTQQSLADVMGVEQPTVQRWESGKREPSLKQLVDLAEILGVEPGRLLGDTSATPLGPRLFVKGTVAAGVWREAMELPEVEWITFTGRAGIEVPTDYRFGLRVEGDSMDQVYPEGTILECVSVFSGIDAAPGRRVIALRTNASGMVEATVKELVDVSGELWLVPRSSNPSHQPFKLGEPGPGISEVRIAAVVVSSVRPE